MGEAVREAADNEGSNRHPTYDGQELVPTDKSPWLWEDPDTGQRFIMSPLSGGVAPIGKGFGRPGRSGRKPKVFKEFCNDMLRDPAVQERLLDLAVSGAPADALRAINTAARYGQALPRQELDDPNRLQVFIGSDAVMGLEIEEGEFEVDQKELPPAVVEEEDYDPPLEDPDGSEPVT